MPLGLRPASWSPVATWAEEQHSPHLLCVKGPTVTLRVVPEGAPLHILATQPDMDALLQEGAEGHVLRQGPVHGPALHQLPASFQDPAQPCGDGRSPAALHALPLPGQSLAMASGVLTCQGGTGRHGRQLTAGWATEWWGRTLLSFTVWLARDHPRAGATGAGSLSFNHPALTQGSHHCAQPNAPRNQPGVVTSMNGEVLHGHGAGHIPNVCQNVLCQASGGAGHAPGLPVQGEEA